MARPSPPNQPLAEQDELIWDDGTVNPEPALDQFDLVSRGGAVRWLLGGLAVFGVAGAAIYVSHPETRTPWAPKHVEVPDVAAEGIVQISRS